MSNEITQEYLEHYARWDVPKQTSLSSRLMPGHDSHSFVRYGNVVVCHEALIAKQLLMGVC